MSLEVFVEDWKKKGKFWDARGSVIAEGFQFAERKPGRPKVVLVNDGSSFRVKMWIKSDEPLLSVQLNENSIALRKGTSKDTGLYQGSFSPNQLKEILSYEITEPVSVEVKEPVGSQQRVVKIEKKVEAATKENESPFKNARRKAYEVYKKEGASANYYALRQAHGTARLWKEKGKEGLERAVNLQYNAGMDWIAKWRPLLKWWDEFVEIPRDQFQRETGFANWEDYFAPGHGSAKLGELKPGLAYYKPKDLYRSARFPIGFVRGKMERAFEIMERELAFIQDGKYSREIVKAASSVGLEHIKGSENWDDGYLWFEHPGNPGVKFPYNLVWLHCPQTGIHYTVGKQFRMNHLMVEHVGRPETLTQEKAWNYLDFLLTSGSLYVDVDYDPRKVMLNHKGELNVHYKKIVKYVVQIARENPPPVILPGMEEDPRVGLPLNLPV